jgi:Rhodopirellula transposase DDE domain
VITAKLSALVEDETAGDPMTDKKWVRRTVRQIRKALKKQGYQLSRSTVWRLLKQLGYRLRANRKRFTGTDQPQRDRQMRYISRVKRLFMAAGYPVISVDTKKKELIGNFKNAGRVWRQQAEEVNAHDFRQAAVAKAVPYGLYDLRHNQGYVYVGTSADTAEFAVEAIVRWWTDPQRPRFAREDQLLILCDAGGSNGYRLRLWKQQLQTRLADALGLTVMVCHYPTGASKWNPIEHRLFSYISLNWAGQPLRSLQTMLNYIRGTTTATGLKVKAYLVEQVFAKGRKISTQEMARLNLVRRRVCPHWNYVIRPRLA